MASGILAKGELTGSLTSVYTCPANTTAFVSINVANRTAGTVTTSINLSTTAGENLGGYIEFLSSIAANQAMEKAGIVLSAGQRILITANSTSTTYVIFGYERTL
jgi:hypothetical protein